MFTGIVRGLCEVVAVVPLDQAMQISLALGPLADNAQDGASIAVNGVCLTVVSTLNGVVLFHVMGETLVRSNLGDVKVGDRVNVERSLKFGDELGGHQLSGHVDCTAVIESTRADQGQTEVTVQLSHPELWSKYLIPKGWISIDGISLTVVKVTRDSFSVCLIPETLERTTLGFKGKGARVNLEFDATVKATVLTLERTAAASGVVAPSASGKISTIPQALEALRRGDMVIVMDDESRENEGDLIMPAAAITPEKAAFMIQHTSGIICVPMPAARAAELQLTPMVANNSDPNRTAFTVSCDAVRAGTGVSAIDRSTTIASLASSHRAEDFRRPGHIFPLVARPNGVLEREGHTEAASDLSALAGFAPIGVIGELQNVDGTMKRLGDCMSFAAAHGLHVTTIAALIAYRKELVAAGGPLSLYEAQGVTTHTETHSAAAAAASVPAGRSAAASPAATSAGAAKAAPAVGKAGHTDAELERYNHGKHPHMALPADVDPRTKRVAILRTSWNGPLVEALTKQCRDQFVALGVPSENIREDVVPGSYELPLAAQSIIKKGNVDAVVCIGVLIKGDTMHFEYIAAATTEGLMRVQLDTGVPVLFGVLTCLTQGQAEARAHPSAGLAATWAHSALMMSHYK